MHPRHHRRRTQCACSPDRAPEQVDLYGRPCAAQSPVAEVLVLTFSTSACGRNLAAHRRAPAGRVRRAWISTFHSFYARLLREHSLMRSAAAERFPGMARHATRLETRAELLEPARSPWSGRIRARRADLRHAHEAKPRASIHAAARRGSERKRAAARAGRRLPGVPAETTNARIVDFRDLISGAIERIAVERIAAKASCAHSSA